MKKLIIPSLMLVTVLFLYIFDIGNLNGLRQGTEGFYLQIAKEMFQENSFIAPLYMGEHHWSKPPLHFWLSFPFYFLEGQASLFSSRLSVVLTSLLYLFLFADWSKRNFNTSRLYAFVFFTACFCFFKYTRIFMMEMPLACLTALGSLYFYDYLNTSKSKFLFLAFLFTGLSILIKGPVSLVMAAGGLALYGAYLLLTKQQLPVKKAILWLSLSLLIGSIWFIICYLRFGDEFFNYFFLRENVGKFTARSYPIRHVFQGLLIYGLPWSLFCPFIYYYFYDNKESVKKGNENLYVFLFCNFVFFFTLWLIPSQRSHHYAVPSIPFFLLLILKGCFLGLVKERRQRLFQFTNYLISGFLIILIFFLGVALTISEVYSNPSHLLGLFIAITSCAFAIYHFTQRNNHLYRFFSAALVFGSLWTVLIPSFTLPLVPGKVIEIVGNKKLASVVHKPYFVSEAFNREVLSMKSHELQQYVQENQSYYLTYKYNYDKLASKTQTDVVYTWSIWKRRRRVSHIIDAIKNGKISELKETMILFKNRDYNPQ